MSTYRCGPAAATLSIIILLVLTMSSAVAQEAEESSLYERLGGLPAISLVVNDFMDAFMEDPVIMSNPAVRERKTPEVAPYIQYQVTTIVCQSTGGPCEYRGSDLGEAHAGLNVSEREWDRMVEILVGVLEQHQVPEREAQELLGILGSTRNDIVVSDN